MRASSFWYKDNNNNDTSAKHPTLGHAGQWHGHGGACVRRQASVGARVAEMSNAVSKGTDISDGVCVCEPGGCWASSYGSPLCAPGDRRRETQAVG